MTDAALLQRIQTADVARNEALHAGLTKGWTRDRHDQYENAADRVFVLKMAHKYPHLSGVRRG